MLSIVRTDCKGSMLDRRRFLVGGVAAVSLAGCSGLEEVGVTATSDSIIPPTDDGMLRAPPGEKHEVTPVDLSKIDPKFHRQVVRNMTREAPGTIVVDPDARFLYLTMSDGRAMRYGIGVGRAGFGWNGMAVIKAKRKWPSWHPPKEMQERDALAAEWAGGMPGGPENPLGARALYLFQGSVDTLYRIHGTAEVWSIGRAVSSGCIRLLNPDIIDLYERVPIGTRVVVRKSRGEVIADAARDIGASLAESVRQMANL